MKGFTNGVPTGLSYKVLEPTFENLRSLNENQIGMLILTLNHGGAIYSGIVYFRGPISTSESAKTPAWGGVASRTGGYTYLANGLYFYRTDNPTLYWRFLLYSSGTVSYVSFTSPLSEIATSTLVVYDLPEQGGSLS